MEDLQNKQELNTDSKELDELGVEWAREVGLEWANAAIEEYEESEATGKIIETMDNMQDGVAKLLKNFINQQDKTPSENNINARNILKLAGVSVKKVAEDLSKANNEQSKHEIIKQVFIWVAEKAPQLSTIWTNQELRKKVEEYFKTATKFWVEHAKYLVVNLPKMSGQMAKEAAQKIAEISEKWEETAQQASEDIVKFSMGPAGTPIIKMMEETWERMKQAGKQILNPTEIEKGFKDPLAYMEEVIKDGVELAKEPIKMIKNCFVAPGEAEKILKNAGIVVLPWQNENEALKNVANATEKLAKSVYGWTKEQWHKIKG